jgi:hypothetical protein
MQTMKRSTVLGAAVLLASALLVTQTASAQGKSASPAGPPNGQGVQVLNTPLDVHVLNTPLQVTGTVNVPSQSRSFFFQSSVPTCDLLNRCSVTYPAVPAGKILRVTRIQGLLFLATANAFVALDLNSLNTQLIVKPVTLFPAAYFGQTLSFDEATEVIFAAGQIPIIEMGTTGTFNSNPFNRLGLAGELFDAQ